jgi:hypothetical protein
MEEFDVPPTIDELRKACGKDPGSNGIPADIVKAGKENSLPVHLHELLLQCWDEGTLPQDMRDIKIVTLYKNKGNCSDCNNYHGISLLSTMGKAFTRVVLNYLQQLQRRPLYLAFIDLTKAFDLVSRTGFFTLLPRI